MIDHLAVLQALRTQLLTLEVATTGSTTLEATATGYARSAGSFVADGFAIGMEVVGAGFGLAANNDAKTLTGVTALTLTAAGCEAEAAGSGRTLSVGLPATRVWLNKDLEPEEGVPYFVEEYVPGVMEAVTVGPNAELEILPLYVPRVLVPARTGVEAAQAYADAILSLFAPRTSLTVSGASCVVRSRPAPYSGQLLQATEGFAAIPVTVPLRVRTANTI